MPDIIPGSIGSDIIAYIGIDGQDKINKTLDGMTGKFSGFASSISASSPIGLAIAAAGAGLASAASAALSFQSNINSLRGTLDMDRGEIAKIGQDLLDISKVNPITYTDLADGIKAIHNEGVPASHYTALLAVAAEASSTGLGSMMDIIKGGIDSYERYADYSSDLATDQATLRDVYDKQFSIVGTGAINYKDLVHYTGQLLPIAQSLGLPMEQLYSAIATLNVNEVNPKGMLMFLQSISKNRDKWEGIGIQVFDPITGSINGLNTIANQFASLTQGKTKEDVSDLYNYLGLTRMTGPVFDTLLQNVNQFNGYLGNIATSQGELRDRAAEATDNIDSQWQMIKNNYNATMIELGTNILPPVVDLLKAINTEIGAINNKPEIMGAGPLTGSYVEPITQFTQYVTAEGTLVKIKDFSKALAGEDGKGGLAKAINTVGDIAAGPTGSGGAAGKVNALNIKMKDWEKMSDAQQALAGIKDITGTLSTNAEYAALHIGDINTAIKPVGTDWRDYTENYKTLATYIGTSDTGLSGGMRGLKGISELAKQPIIDLGGAIKDAGDKTNDAQEVSFDLAEAFGAIADSIGDKELSKVVSTIGGIASAFSQGGVVGGGFAIFTSLAGALISLGKDKEAALTVEQVIDSLGSLGDRVKEMQDFDFDDNALFSDQIEYMQEQIDRIINKGSTLTLLERQRLEQLLATIEPLKKISDSLDTLEMYSDSVTATLNVAREYVNLFGSQGMKQSNDMLISAGMSLINYANTLERGTAAYDQTLYNLAKIRVAMGRDAAGLGALIGSEAESQVQSYINLINTFGDAAYDAASGIRSFSIELDSMLKQLTGQYTQFEKDTKLVSETIKQLLYFKVDLDTTDLDEKIALSIKAMNAYLATLNPDSDAWKDAQKLIDELTQQFEDLGGVLEDIPGLTIGTTGQTPTYASGGYVPNAGLAMLHGNEFVLDSAATSALGIGRLKQYSASLDPSVLVANGGSAMPAQSNITVQVHEATPATWVQITDRNIHPRVTQRDRRYKIGANPYAN